MIKLKKLLNETTNAWERKFGESLPTLEDTTKAYALKQENLNEADARNDKSIGTKNYKGIGWFWPSDSWKHYLRATSDKGRKEVHDLWLKAGFEIKIDNRGIPGFDIKSNERNKAMKIVDMINKRIPIKESVNENKDLLKVATTLGKSPSDINKFLKKHKLDADDLLDVIESGGRRYSLAIIAAMRGNRRALRQLDDLLGFL
tara:strand:+ start:74 stop:679 length:606 start_codon:yes stop_codon:yes gene_type:complete